MKTLTYKSSRIETILTEDNQPVFIAIIDGSYEPNQTYSSNEEECLFKAKKVVDQRQVYSKAGLKVLPCQASKK